MDGSHHGLWHARRLRSGRGVREWTMLRRRILIVSWCKAAFGARLCGSFESLCLLGLARLVCVVAVTLACFDPRLGDLARTKSQCTIVAVTQHGEQEERK